MSDISGIQYNEPTENTSTNMIEQFDKEFVFDEDAEKLVMNYGEGNGITEATPKDIKAFILKSLKEQDKKHFFEMEELRLKEGGFRIKQHKIYDEKLKTQREEIIKEIEGMKMTKDKLGYVGELSNEHKVKNKTIKKIIKILK